MHRFRFNLIFALCFGAAVTLFGWLLVSPESPVESSSETLKYAIGLIQLFAALMAMTLSGSPHLGSVGAIIYWVLVLAQWSIIGLGISFLFKLKGRNDAA
jgi:hypothetical protein